MDNCMVFHTQIASVMEVLANAAVADICKLVDDDYAVFRLEITQSQKENRALRRKLLELKVARERAERTMRERVLGSRPSSVKILDRYRGMTRGEGHLTGGYRSFVKPAGHNTWKDDQPITVDEDSGTSTQHVIMIESAEAAGPGVKLERSEGEDPRHSRDIQDGAASGVAPPVATEDLSTAAALQSRNRRSITEPAVHEELLISDVAGGRDWNSVAGGHKPLPWIRTLDQEPSLFFPESEPGPNREEQRLHHNHHTEHNQWTGGLNNLSPGGHQRDKGSSQGSSLQPRPFSSQSQCRDGAGPGADRERSSCSYETNTSVSMMNKAGHPGLQLLQRVVGDTPGGSLSESLSSPSGSRLIPDDWVHRKPGPGSSLPQLPHGYPTNTDRVRMGIHHKRYLAYNAAHNPNNTQTMDRGQAGSSKTNQLSVVAPASSYSGVIGSQRAKPNIRTDADKPYACPTCGKCFAEANYVKIHQRVHTGEKPFSCTQCHMHFAEAGTLKRHQRIHTGEKPYSCPQCEKRFSHQHHLKRHLKVHT
ncbi:zinc finger protein 768-like isoform X2 [Salmo trutta]|uniref:zinc finger protein 768-like isoform X2 n=1 Tax=Salmo trutta TaxID=8032 RepID=UPI0011318556|nr:zinc finger protein 768-like isoform X2 [Salmo trutta]